MESLSKIYKTNKDFFMAVVILIAIIIAAVIIKLMY